jgi:hypothetical protein
MRQGQQKRMRGRNRGGGGGGKGPNPLNRTFESNGPDVKVRGTAAHIAEKYVQLARDAQTSGDPILAEAYLQHAEHYFRVIAAAQPQFNVQQPFGQPQEEEEEGDDMDFEGPIPSMPQTYAPSQGGQPGAEDQSRFPQPQRERGYGDRGYGDRGYSDRPSFGDRQGGERNDGERQHADRFRGDRYPHERGQRYERPFDGPSNNAQGESFEGERGFNPRHARRDRRFGDRPYQDRQHGERQSFQDRQERSQERFEPRGERPFQPQAQPQPQPQPVPVVPVDQPQPDVADDAALSALPSFITTGPAAAAPAPPVEGEGEARFPLRNRRRRAPKRSAGTEEGESPAPETGVEPVGD